MTHYEEWSGDDISECVECGHLHWDYRREVYISCPVDGCDCQGQDLERFAREVVDIGRERPRDVWTEATRSADGTAVHICCKVRKMGEEAQVVEEATASSGVPEEATVIANGMLRRWS